MKLRDYQANAVAAVHEQLEQVRSTLVVMPTGCGKTVLFAKVADERTRGRVMVVAHREELIRQAALKITAVTGEHVEIEMADERADQFGLLGRSRFVVASVQTLCRPKRLQRFNPADFGTLIIDEAHHAVTASYKVIIDHFTQNPDLRILGVTATPDRADEIALGKIFESVAFNYEILDAINDGWLVPITSRTVKVEGLDFSHIRTTAGDLNGKELAELLEQEKLLHEVAGPTLELARARKVLVFASSVKQAERLAEIFNRHRPDCARWVCGKTDREVRAQVLRDYSARPMRFQFLVNVGVFTEGFDEPCIDMIVMARPTKSRALYAQMCLDSRTEILTRRGWMGIDTIRPDDEVAAFDMGTGSVLWSPTLNTVRRFTLPGESMCSIASPSLDIRVTGGHDMIHRRRYGRKRARTAWSKITADALASLPDHYEIPVAGEQVAPGVPLTDEELRFIGWFVTDGTLNVRTNAITICQSEHQPYCRDIEKCLAGCGFKFSIYRETRRTQFKESSTMIKYVVSKGEPRGRDKHLSGWGRLAEYIDKDLSPAMESMTADQLGVFLEAVHLGDGAKQLGQSWTRRTYHIATGNAVFADRLQSLCVRRGFRCNIAEHNYNKSPLYVLHIKREAARYVGGASSNDRPRLRREDAYTPELVWCVESITGAIITRRNGKVAIVGNCGRGTRPLPGVVDGLATPEERRAAIARSRKPNVEILDFEGNAGQHKLICPADILGGRYEDAVVHRATRNAAKAGRAVNIADELKKAEAEIKDERAKAKRANITARAEYTTQTVDPFDILDIEPRRERGWDTSKGPSEPMLRTLERGGVEIVERGGKKYVGDRELTRALAGQLCGEIIQRWNKRLCSIKQAKVLKKYGYPTDMTFDEARRTLDRLAANGWRRPADEPAEVGA